MKDKNIVYIVGAGASKDYGLPLGDEIFEFAYKLLSLKKKTFGQEFEKVIDIVEEIMKLLFIGLPEIKSDYPLFEEVLTFIWDTKKTERFDYDKNKLISIFEKYVDAKGALNHFVKMLVFTIAGCMIYFMPRQKIEAYRQYIRSLNFKKDNISFISLNYDILLDNILSDCVNDGLIEDFTYGIPLADALIKLDYPDRNRKYLREKGILLLKPHGSINLVNCPVHKQATYGEGYFYFKKVKDVLRNYKIQCPSCGHATNPLIIPPLYNKKDFVEDTKPKTTRLVWRSTADVYREITNKVQYLGIALRISAGIFISSPIWGRSVL